MERNIGNDENMIGYTRTSDQKSEKNETSSKSNKMSKKLLVSFNHEEKGNKKEYFDGNKSKFNRKKMR